MDVSGENQIDVDHDLFKQRLSLSGERIEDEPEKEGKSYNHWHTNSIKTGRNFLRHKLL